MRWSGSFGGGRTTPPPFPLPQGQRGGVWPLPAMTPAAPWTFLRQFARSPRSIGAVLPSSAALAEAMLAPVDFSAARTVVEFGPGTGAFTRAIAQRLPSHTRYLGIELNPTFCRSLALSFPRLRFRPWQCGRSDTYPGTTRRDRGRCDRLRPALGLPADRPAGPGVRRHGSRTGPRRRVRHLRLCARHRPSRRPGAAPAGSAAVFPQVSRLQGGLGATFRRPSPISAARPPV